jgi:hypothetical protein
MSAFMDAFIPSFGVGTTFGLAELYKVDADDGERHFVYAFDTNLDGTSGDPQIPQVEGIWIFKTVGGGLAKIYAMEGVYTTDVRNVGNVPAGPRQDLVDYITSVENVVYGRDNTYPLAFMSFTSKTNDRLRRRQGFTNV